VTDSTVEPEDFSVILTARAHAEEAERQRNIRRAIAAGAVLVVHILVLVLLIYAGKIPLVTRVKTTVPEAIWILLPNKPLPPKPHNQTPPPQELENVAPQTAPITLPPAHHQPLAEPQSGGLAGVGRSIACGASIYENLPPAVREQCRRHPWAFVRRSDGTIVLDVPKGEPPPTFTSGDITRHEMQTAPPCPPLINVPCLSKVLPNRDPVTNGSQQ